MFRGELVVDTSSGYRVLETYHPPTYYLPVLDFVPGCLVPSRRTSYCEWKGAAQYFSVQSGGSVAADAAWGYPAPSAPFGALLDHVAVYAGPMDACFVDEERVVPQPGGFYGGWVTADLVGPFKGGPGTLGW